MQSEEKFFPLEDEYPHPIGDDIWWQESVFLTWWDDKAGVGGFHRIGQEPHAAGGAVASYWLGLFTRDGQRYRRHVSVPLRDVDRGERLFRCSDAFAMAHDGQDSIWTIDLPDCEMHLVAQDYTPRFDLWGHGGTVTQDFAPGHFEVGGTIRGRLRIGERQFDIDGVCYRDHSWGRREWSTLLSHRWIAGSVGPELTFNAASWHGTDGSLRSFGIVSKNGVVTHAVNTDIVVYMETDACTHRGGVLSMQMPDGERITLRPRLIDGALTLHNNIACIDTICTVEYQGRKGFCDFEITTNPRAGSGPIKALVRATMQDGLSRRDWTLPPEYGE